MKLTKIIAVALIVLGIAGFAYYKFIYVPKYQAYDFLINLQDETKKLPMVSNMDKFDPEANSDDKLYEESYSKTRGKYSKFILENFFVYAIKRQEYKSDNSYNSKGNKESRKPLYVIELAPYKTTEDGRIVILDALSHKFERVEGFDELYTFGNTRPLPLPAVTFEKDYRPIVFLNVYDTTIFSKFKIAPVCNLSNDPIGFKNKLNPFFMTSLSVKVSLAEKDPYHQHALKVTGYGQGGYSETLLVRFDLIDVISATDVVTDERKRVESFYKYDYTTYSMTQIKTYEDTVFRFRQNATQSIPYFIGSIVNDRPHTGRYTTLEFEADLLRSIKPDILSVLELIGYDRYGCSNCYQDFCDRPYSRICNFTIEKEKPTTLFFAESPYDDDEHRWGSLTLGIDSLHRVTYVKCDSAFKGYKVSINPGDTVFTIAPFQNN